MSDLSIESKPNRSRGTLLLVLAALVYPAIGLVTILHHPMWRDEAQAWQIVLKSGSLQDLFARMRFEGHPPLWYLLLYAVKQFTLDPRAMQILHLSLATLTAWMVLFLSPFRKWERVGLAFGYFLAYEYAIISRSYVLTGFFLFIVCVMLTRPRINYALLSLVLVLLANVSIYALVIAVAVAMGVAVEWFIHRKQEDAPGGWLVTACALVFAGGIAVSLASSCQGMMTNNPWNGRNVRQTLQQGEQEGVSLPKRLVGSEFLRSWRAFAPIPNFRGNEKWEGNLVADWWRDTDLRRGQTLACELGVPLVLLAFWAMFRSRLAVVTYLLGSQTLLLAWAFDLPRSVRHLGSIYLLLIGGLWIARSEMLRKGLVRGFWLKGSNACANLLLWVVVFVQLGAAGISFYTEWTRPFTRGRDVAQYLLQNGYGDDVVIVNPEFHAASISTYLGKDVYLPIHKVFAGYIPQDIERKRGSTDDLREGVEAWIGMGKPVVIVNGEYDVLDLKSDQFTLEKIATFEGSVAPLENYYVYLASGKTTATSRPATTLPGN